MSLIWARYMPSVSIRTLLIASLAIAPLALGSCGGPGKKSGSGTRTLYLVRHGEYDAEDTRDPEIGKALDELGRFQSQLVGQRLAAIPVEMNAIYTSPMTRARETAVIVAQNFPRLEPVVVRELAECIPPTDRKDVMKDVDAKDARACRDQFDQAFDRFFVPPPKGDVHEILIFHGNAIRYLVGRAIGLDKKKWLNLSIGNCSLTEVLILADGSIKLVSFDDQGHIPPTMQTLAGTGQRYGARE